MKFNNFVKAIGSEGFIYKDEEGGKWLCGLGCALKIPETTGSVCSSKEFAAPTWFNDIVFSDPDDMHPVKLEEAYLPDADSKTSEVRRVFALDGKYRVNISNKSFSLIEKRDFTQSVECELPNRDDVMLGSTALMVVDPISEPDEPNILGIIFNIAD